jgi:hypothetical protein
LSLPAYRSDESTGRDKPCPYCKTSPPRRASKIKFELFSEEIYAFTLLLCTGRARVSGCALVGLDLCFWSVRESKLCDAIRRRAESAAAVRHEQQCRAD